MLPTRTTTATTCGRYSNTAPGNPIPSSASHSDRKTPTSPVHSKAATIGANAPAMNSTIVASTQIVTTNGTMIASPVMTTLSSPS
jgi:hypothetical protein